MLLNVVNDMEDESVLFSCPGVYERRENAETKRPMND